MTRKICLLIIVLAGFIHQPFFAQPNTLWTKTFGGAEFDTGTSVQQTSDGGYIIAGYTGSFGAGSNDVWLVKTNASGDTLWTKTFGGSESETGQSVLQTYDGGYIISGNTDSYGAGLDDVWLIKTDAAGDTLWTKTIGGNNNDSSYEIQHTSDNGYIIIGLTTSFGAGANDIWLIKTDASGDTLWTKTFGGSNHELGASVQQTLDNGYIITGSTLSFGAGSDDSWLIKTDASGDTLWTKTFGGNSAERFWSIQQTDDSGYIMTGYTDSFGAGSRDVWLVKTDASGDTLWTKTYGGSGDETGRSVLQTDDGGYIISGYTDSYGAGLDDVWLIKTDASGDTLWTQTFGGSEDDRSNSVYQTTDQGYIITGQTKSYGQGNNDIWLIRTAPDVPTAVAEDRSDVPESHKLFQNYPNPFNANTRIQFYVPKDGKISLKIFSTLGQEIRSLTNRYYTQGYHSVNWDGRNAKGKRTASGIYLYKLKADDFQVTRRLNYIR